MFITIKNVDLKIIQYILLKFHKDIVNKKDC